MIRITKTTKILLRLWIITCELFSSLKHSTGITGVLFHASWMSPVLANRTSLWRQISTNVMQSPPSSSSSSRATVAPQLAQLCSLLTTLLTAYHPPHVSLPMPASIYAILHSLSVQQGQGPQGRDHPSQGQFCPTAGSSRCSQPSSPPAKERVMPLRHVSSSQRPSEIHWPPQEPAWKGTADTHSLFSPSVHPRFTALDAGKWNALIALHKSALHLYFGKPKAMECLGDEGESSTNSVCCGNCCGHQDPETPGTGEYLQVSTELLDWLLLLLSHPN